MVQLTAVIAENTKLHCHVEPPFRGVLVRLADGFKCSSEQSGKVIVDEVETQILRALKDEVEEDHRLVYGIIRPVVLVGRFDVVESGHVTEGESRFRRVSVS